jgi:uncharacterized protein YigA (DUF484 family)
VFRPPLTELAKRLAALTAPADATDNLLRYEAHLDRQLYRAMDQLERLQRQRRGETLPPSAEHQLKKREIAVLPNKANKCFIINRSSEKLKWLLRQESARTAILGGLKIKIRMMLVGAGATH